MTVDTHRLVARSWHSLPKVDSLISVTSLLFVVSNDHETALVISSILWQAHTLTYPSDTRVIGIDGTDAKTGRDNGCRQRRATTSEDTSAHNLQHFHLA
jgi:hypothetical protein